MSEKQTGFHNLKRLILVIAIELFAVVAVVWFFDPFYQYHAPFVGEAVLNDRDNQVPGTIRTFDYDSVLVGSSVAENCDSTYLDRVYGCSTLKVIKASGSTADLLYYLDMVREHRELKNVFYCLDISALSGETETVLYGDEYPRYLHTDTVLDDWTYLVNKEILLEKIPMSLAYGAMGRNTGGQAYDWSADKDFSRTGAMRAYEKPAENLPEMSFEDEKEKIAANIQMLVSEIESHPNTEYALFMPPYSLLWWDCAKANGYQERYFYILEQLLPRVTELSNAKVYDYQAEADIVLNLDNYMDMIHYGPWVNQWMLESMGEGKDLLTQDNWPDYIQRMRDLAKRISDTEIYEYY